MRNLLFAVLAIIILAACQTKPVSNGSPAEFKIFKGTNIAHWLSQSDARGAERDSFFRRKTLP